MATFVSRMIGAAKLDTATFEEVEADKSALGQAMLVVVLSSLAAGIGNVVRQGGLGLIVGIIAGLLGWLLWAWLTYFIGTKILPDVATEADLGQLLRVTGFSASPGLLRIFGAVPLLGPVIFFITAVWMLVAFVIAVRQALDYRSTWRAVAVCLIGWVVYLVFFAVFTIIFGGLPPEMITS